MIESSQPNKLTNMLVRPSSNGTPSKSQFNNHGPTTNYPVYNNQNNNTTKPLMQQPPIPGSRTTVSIFNLVIVAVGLVVYVQVSLTYFELKLVAAIHKNGSANDNGNNGTVNALVNQIMTAPLMTALEEDERLAHLALFGSHLHTSNNVNTSATANPEKVPTQAPSSQATEVPRIPATATTNTQTHSHDLPSCIELMNAPGAPYGDGQFLSRHTIPVSWHPRADHSRELRHSMCHLHRYTATEAQQCLAGKHLFTAGDSLSRYQFLSLATFLHKQHYPPRFGKGTSGYCKHLNEQGLAACSPPDEPNICMEGDWSGGGQEDSWLKFVRALGSYLFGGHMEANAIRKGGIKGAVENYVYASPLADNSTAAKAQQIVLSFVNEIGWGNDPTPIHGFNFTGCAFEGTCNFTDEMAEERLQRHVNGSYDFSEPFVEAIGPQGVLRQVLPPVDVAFYNRGIWGVLSDTNKNQNITQNLYEFSGGDQGRCFFRTSTGRFQPDHERGHVRKSFLDAGCGYVDHAHLVADFNNLNFQPRPPPAQNIGGAPVQANFEERRTVFWDLVHFAPWVYEELNNLQLNILCNVVEQTETKSTA